MPVTVAPKKNARLRSSTAKDKRGVDLISNALPFGRLWYAELNAVSNAIGYSKFFSRSHDAVIRVYDAAGNVIETHEHAGDFKEEQPAFEGWRGPNSYSSSVANAIRP